MNTPTIIFFATTLEAADGGIARSVPRLARAVQDAGIAVTLIAPSPRELGVPNTILDGMRVILPTSRTSLWTNVRQQLTVAPRRSIAYHAGVWSQLNHGFATLARRHGVPYVASTRSSLDPWALSFKRWKKQAAWWAYAKNDLCQAIFVHATSRLEVNHIRSKIPGVPIVDIPHGVETPCKESLAAPPSRRLKRLLFLSRLHPKKGLEDLLAAFKKTRPTGWELVIVGEGSPAYERRLRSLASPLLNEGKIDFVGKVADGQKWDWYRSSDLFILPSYSENFGLVIAEALAAGVPVITTSATPWESLITMGCGWCVPPGETTIRGALAEAFATDERCLREMGIQGAAWMRESFTWHAVGQRFVAACEKALAHKQSGPRDSRYAKPSLFWPLRCD